MYLHRYNIYFHVGTNFFVILLRVKYLCVCSVWWVWHSNHFICANYYLYMQKKCNAALAHNHKKHARKHTPNTVGIWTPHIGLSHFYISWWFFMCLSLSSVSCNKLYTIYKIPLYTSLLLLPLFSNQLNVCQSSTFIDCQGEEGSNKNFNNFGQTFHNRPSPLFFLSLFSETFEFSSSLWSIHHQCRSWRTIYGANNAYINVQYTR